jgi:thymidylate synthase (FAD)
MAESMKEVKRIKVLDKGHVDLIDYMGNDITVVNAARVSFNTRSEYELDIEGFERVQANGNKEHFRCEFLKISKKDEKLIKYLASHNHWTPFGHPQITLRIKAPISIRTQFFKHKQGFVENEISRRYVSTEPEFYIPQWRNKPKEDTKQGSDGFIDISSKSSRSFNSAIKKCQDAYDQLIKEGIAPEQARFVLPQGMYTEWYWTGSLAAYARFYSLRSADYAQWEIREYADAVGQMIGSLYPISWKYLTAKEK